MDCVYSTPGVGNSWADKVKGIRTTVSNPPVTDVETDDNQKLLDTVELESRELFLGKQLSEGL